MKTEVDIYERAFRFAVEIVHLSDELYKSRGSKAVMAKQLLRSGTSVGANLEEARTGQSKTDFIAKLSISRKEAEEVVRETRRRGVEWTTIFTRMYRINRMGRAAIGYWRLAVSG